MNEEIMNYIIVGIIVIIGVFLLRYLWRTLVKSFSSNPSQREYDQLSTNIKASQQPDGPGGGLKSHKKGSLSWIVWLIIAIVLAYLLISGGIIENILSYK